MKALVDRVLVVGLGSIGKRHLRILREMLPNADIRVLRRSFSDTETELANGCFDSIESAKDFSPEISVIANPAPFHMAHAKVLAQAGSHLLVEKPVSDSSSGVDELIQLCAANGLIFQVGYNLRFLETLQFFRDGLLNGIIGEVRSVRCEVGQYLPDWRPDADYRKTVSAQRALGGGVLLELSHEIDMLRWVFGEVDWVSAWIGRQGELCIDVEDCAMLQMGFRTGPIAQVGMDFLRRDTTRICTAIGEGGSLRWDAVSGCVSRFDLDGRVWSKLRAASPGRDSSYRVQLATFLAAVDGHSTSVSAQGYDGLAVMRLIDAMRASDGQNGRRVMLGQ